MTAPERAVRKVRWSAEPAMQEWMEANERGLGASELSARFADEFGFPLSRPQIALWRSMNGRTTRAGRGGGKPRIPVGGEKVKSGYVYVKTAERPTRGQSGDNWTPKNVHVWEREHGPLPEGHVVVFADGDARNFDPANLVAVPRRDMARLNNKGGWSDADGLAAAVAVCELESAICDADGRVARTCGVCGAPFAKADLPEGSRYADRKTCPACLAAGRKARGERRARSGPATARCAVCGAVFAKETSHQVRCRACIDAKPKHNARNQRREMGL